MLKTAQNIRNVITIFHNPQLKASKDLVTKVQNKFKDPQFQKFDLQIDEGVPTADQLSAMKKYTPLLANISSPAHLPRPTLVSWFNGKVAVNNEQRALAIINAADSKPAAEL